MADDIKLSLSTKPIKNGTMLASCSSTGKYSYLSKQINDPNNSKIFEDHVNNLPSFDEIKDKYDLRFDNPSYYHGGGIGSVDGGDVGEDSSSGTGIYDGGTYEG